MVSSHNIVKDLLKIKAVQIHTKKYFTWTSGLKSPIYCDNRLTMSYPQIRKKIMQLFIEKVNDLKEKPNIIAGCATAGIPHAAWLADALDLPLVYVRSTPKEHGKGNQIEGVVVSGQKAVVIEDLVSTGGSSLNVAKALQNEGVEVLAVLTIFSYGLQKSIDQFKREQIPLYTLTTFDELVDILVEDNQLNEQQRQELITWRNHLSYTKDN